MLHLDTQNGEEATKTLEYQKYLGDTAACTERLMMYNKWCGKLTSNSTYFADGCFSSVKFSEEAMAAGVDRFGLAKTSHTGSCQDTLNFL